MNKAIRVSGLNSIRGIGACLIVTFHIWALMGFSGLLGNFDIIISNFDSVVRLFFMISAFSLMCGYEKTLLLSEENLKNFYVRRFIKLAPLYYLIMIVQIILSFILYEEKFTLTQIISNITFIFGLIPGQAESIVMAGWTIGIEWVFYLIFPIFIILTRKKILYVCVLLSIIVTANFESLMVLGNHNPTHINIVKYFSYFFLGATLYRLFPLILKYKIKKIGIINDILYIIISLVIGYAITKVFNRDIGMLIGFFLLLVFTINGFSRLIDNRMTQFLGRISLSIYLTHPIIIVLFSRMGIVQYFAKYTNSTFYLFILTTIFILSITIIVSVITTKYVEHAFIDMWNNK